MVVGAGCMMHQTAGERMSWMESKESAGLGKKRKEMREEGKNG